MFCFCRLIFYNLWRTSKFNNIQWMWCLCVYINWWQTVWDTSITFNFTSSNGEFGIVFFYSYFIRREIFVVDFFLCICVRSVYILDRKHIFNSNCKRGCVYVSLVSTIFVITRTQKTHFYLFCFCLFRLHIDRFFFVCFWFLFIWQTHEEQTVRKEKIEKKQQLFKKYLKKKRLIA